MDARAGTISAYQQLVQMLDSQEVLAAILSKPKDIMTQQQKDALVRLARHFADSQAGDSDVSNDQEDQGYQGNQENEDGGEEGGPGKKRKRSGTGRKKPRHPWGAFLRLKDLRLPPEVEKHLRKKGTDPMTFLVDDKVLEHKIDMFGSEAVADALMACYEYTLRLETRQTTDYLRWCFNMLMYFDLVQLVRPKGSGQVGPVILKDIAGLLGPVFEQVGVDKDQALQNIDKWSVLGAKLSQLCAEFGAGCLFFLGNLLSPNFLTNNHTGTDHYHEEAFAHLRQLGLKEKAIESGAQDIGAGVRRLLNKPFRSALRDQREGVAPG